jgi:hypothetical protein
MRLNWIRGLVFLAVAAVLIGEMSAVSAQRSGGQKKASQEKPTPNNRFGRWKMDQNTPPPTSNIMTYEPWSNGGMKITVAMVNAQGQQSQWSYETLFDGQFRPVTGQQGSETAVEFINDHSTRIQNKRNGKVNQIVINTLSDDLKTINNEYVVLDDDGKIIRVTHAVYRKIE